MRRLFFVFWISTLFGEMLWGMPLAAGEGMTRIEAKAEEMIDDTRLPTYLPTWENGGLAPAKTPEQVASVLQVVALLTFLTLAPSLLILMTCFTRIVIVLGFLRRALATQTVPPDQVIVGLSLFLTFFIMAPTWEMAWKDGLRPYLNGEIDTATGRRMTQEEAFYRMLAPQRRFMQACLEANEGTDEVLFFMEISGRKKVEGTQVLFLDEKGAWVPLSELRMRDIPTLVLIPAYLTSELKRSFWMGFLLYVPFLVLDMVIASILMGMGMMMLPPVMISLPFKIILFVLVDGWNLVMKGLLTSFPAEVLQVVPQIGG